MIEYYNYPSQNQVSPFDPVDGEAYFAYAGKISYLGSFEEIGSIGPFDSRSLIFPGEYVLNIFKRYALIASGRLLYINPRFADGHKIGFSRLNELQYAICTDFLHEYRVDSWKAPSHPLKTHTIQNEDGGYNSTLQLKLFSEVKAAVQFAKELSLNTSMNCIVAQWFSDIDRH